MSFGKVLMRTREEKGLKIKDISETLKIKAEYLQAFEREDFQNVPVEPYGIGFLKNYMVYLEIYDEDILKKYHQKRKKIIEHIDGDLTEHVHYTDPLINKIKYFQMSNFWENSMLSVRKHKKIILKIVFGLGVIFAILFSSLIYTVNKGNIIQNLTFSEFTKLDKYCLEVFVKSTFWMSVHADDKLYVSRTVKKGDLFRVFGNDYIKLVIGNIETIDVSINGKIVDVKKNAKSMVNTVILNQDTITDWVI